MKKVTVHYRRLVDHRMAPIDFATPYNHALNAMINGNILRDHDVSRITTNSAGERVGLLYPENNVHHSFGEIAVFKEGDIPFAEYANDGSVALRTVQLEDNEEAIKGSSYFMFRGSHVAILHSDSSTGYLQEYFNWLLRAPIGNLPPDQHVTLMPMIQVGGRPVAFREIKALKLRADVHIGDPVRDGAADGGLPRSFMKMIDRKIISAANIRTVLRALGMSDGSLNDLSDAELESIELELLLRKKEGRNITPLPDDLMQGVINSGLDRAAEFQAEGGNQRGDAVVAKYATEVDLVGAYYELTSVKRALNAALESWSDQGLI